MQIIIDISNNDYEYLKKTSFVEDEKRVFEQTAGDRKGTMMLFRLIDSVKNGTPLPKGHGRLIDADRLYDDFEYADYDFEEALEYAPTVIEADEEEK